MRVVNVVKQNYALFPPVAELVRRLLLGLVSVVVNAPATVRRLVVVFLVVGLVAPLPPLTVKTVVAAPAFVVPVVVVWVSARNRTRVVTAELFCQRVVLDVLVRPVPVATRTVVLPFARAVRRLLVLDNRQPLAFVPPGQLNPLGLAVRLPFVIVFALRQLFQVYFPEHFVFAIPAFSLFP